MVPSQPAKTPPNTGPDLVVELPQTSTTGEGAPNGSTAAEAHCTVLEPLAGTTGAVV